MGLLEPLAVLDFFEELLRRLRCSLLSIFAFSCAINSRINEPWSATMRGSHIGDAGERLWCEQGVAGGVQSRSSKTSGNNSSSEMMKEWLWYSSSELVSLDSEDRRGHEGYAQEGLDFALDDGISIGEVVE